MESLFSDLFFKDDWLVIMDHIVCDPVNMADAFAIAYSSVSREILLTMSDVDAVTNFLRHRMRAG